MFRVERSFLLPKIQSKKGHTVNGRDSRDLKNFVREGVFMPQGNFFVRRLYFPESTPARRPVPEQVDTNTKHRKEV